MTEKVTLEIIDGPDPAMEDGWEHYAYTIELHYDGRTLELPWKQGLAITSDPNPRHVLEALYLDSSALSLDFEEWAGEYGYDTDSRKAEAMYQATRKLAEGLRVLLGEDWDAFQRIGDAEAAARRYAAVAS